MSTINEAVEFIEGLTAENGETLTLVRAHLTIAGFKPAVIAAAVKEAKEAGLIETHSRSTGFSSTFYAWLVESSRTKEEVVYFLNDGTSDNTKRHESHYLNIYYLAEAVRVECAKEEAA